MKRVRIVSTDVSPGTVKITDADTGEPITNIRAVTIRMTPTSMVEAEFRLLIDELDIVAQNDPDEDAA